LETAWEKRKKINYLRHVFSVFGGSMEYVLDYLYVNFVSFFRHTWIFITGSSLFISCYQCERIHRRSGFWLST